MPLPANFYDIGKTFIESHMLDRCMINRDRPGVYNDILDEDTLELVRPPSNDTLVYSGVCTIRAVSAKDMSYDEGELAVFRKAYNLFLPQDTPEVMIGDTVKFLAPFRDATLTDKEFRVMEVRFSTHSTYRFVRLEDVQQDTNPTNPST